jgi:hypothetical protein
VDDAEIKKQFPDFDGMERPKVWNNVTQDWTEAKYQGSKEISDAQGNKRVVDEYVMELPGTTQLLLNKDNFKVAVVADSNVGPLPAQEPGDNFPVSYKPYQLVGR